MTSSWWPVPARPSTWFAQDQLQASARYHKPIERVAIARTVARFTGLVASVPLTRWLLDGDDGWLVRLAVASVLTTIALWVPATASDWWFDQKHEPTFGARPLPRARLAVGSMVSGLGTLLSVLVSAGLLYWLIETSPLWAFTVPPALVLLIGAGSYLGHRAGMQARALQPLDTKAKVPFDALLGSDGSLPSHGLRPSQGAQSRLHSQLPLVSFWIMSSSLEAGRNGLTTSVGRRPAIAVTRELLEAPVDIQRLVVAHELGHIHLGHLRQMVVLGVAQTLVVGAGTCWVLQMSSLEEFQDPQGVPFVALTVWVLASLVGLVGSWVERAHERQADDVAFVLTKPIALQHVRSLHVTDRADLQPSLLSRLLASHPSPAERLHRFSLARSDE